jgi:hypothetical protein
MFCHKIIEGTSNIGDSGAKPLSTEQLHNERRKLKETQDAAKKKQKEDNEKKEKEKAEADRQTALRNIENKKKLQIPTQRGCSIQ